MDASRAAFSLESAARDAGENIALVFESGSAEGSVTYAALRRAGAQKRAQLGKFFAEHGHLLGPGARPLALVAEANPKSVVLILTALDAGQPIVLLHPSAPRQQQRRTADLVGAAVFWNGQTFESWDAPAPPFGVPKDAAVLLETSGSTGEPKLVMHSTASLAAAAIASARNLGWLPEGDRWLLSLPLSHVGGLSILLRCFLGRQTSVLAPLPTHAPKLAMEHLERLDISLLSLVPTQLARLLSDADFRFPPRVRHVLIGGAPLSAHLRERARQRAVPLLSTYGMTEFGSQICTERPGDVGAGVGPALPGTDVRLGQDGRIQVRSPTAFLGYWGRPSPFDEDGWFTTNDRGEWDERGHLHVLGRTDHMIITGGENVQPEQVEAALAELEGVAAVGVVGVADEQWGQKLVAAVVLADAQEEQAPARVRFERYRALWHEQLRERLPRFALPKQYVRLERLPVLGIGKMDRHRLLPLVEAALAAED